MYPHVSTFGQFLPKPAAATLQPGLQVWAPSAWLVIASLPEPNRNRQESMWENLGCSPKFWGLEVQTSAGNASGLLKGEEALQLTLRGSLFRKPYPSVCCSRSLGRHVFEQTTYKEEGPSALGFSHPLLHKLQKTVPVLSRAYRCFHPIPSPREQALLSAESQATGTALQHTHTWLCPQVPNRTLPATCGPPSCPTREPSQRDPARGPRGRVTGRPRPRSQAWGQKQRARETFLKKLF